ncbi:MAG: SDR family NAD(P)-dependent oxidoreductase [Deltaproteobacteria bacterium]|nr:MAG: SDR family NAD(P)-dependent oxidoreductase [Deltaproteobacteria bacterium]
MTRNWTAADVPDLSGRTIIVTGANSGIGYEAALGLARKGAHVVLACRNLDKACDAIEAIQAAQPAAKCQAMELDLASLASVRSFAASFRAEHGALHALCNNAGVMALPYRRTRDDFEMQFGTNHLGHFALTGLLLERLLETPGARVVTVSSNLHWVGKIAFDDLRSARRYGKWAAYAQSKLANLLFAYELQRRLDARTAPTTLISVGVHPGYSATNLQFVGARMEGSSWMETLSNIGNRIIAQDAAGGALPTLYGVTSPDARGGDYIGPGGFLQLWGAPRKVGGSPRARDPELARKLWSVSEELTGVRYDALSG